MTTLALFSNKGGVGKTTAAVNLAYLAAQSGQRTLLCDLDPQSSATFYLNARPANQAPAGGLSSAAAGTIYQSILAQVYPNLDLLPADFAYRNLDITYNQHANPAARLEQALVPLKADYDLLILDCPPTINILAENIFRASDYLLVPLIPTILSVRTYAQLLGFLEHKRYPLLGVYSFFSLVDGRRKMHAETMEAVPASFNGVFETIIPYRSSVEKMEIERRPLPDFAAKDPAAIALASCGPRSVGHPA